MKMEDGRLQPMYMQVLDPGRLLAEWHGPESVAMFPKNKPIYLQGDPAAHVYYIQRGLVKSSVLAVDGEERALDILGRGDFIGIECIAGNPTHFTTTVAITRSQVLKVDRAKITGLLRHSPDFSVFLAGYLASRSLRLEHTLLVQLSDTSEMRLAHVLLMLSGLEPDSECLQTIPRISQQILADMVGTTRSRTSYFMNRFRTRGLIAYDSSAISVSPKLRTWFNDAKDH